MSISNTRQVFSDLIIPFAGTILGGLVPGEMVVLQGSVPPGSDRFQVDFTCGSSVKPRADVAFHFNPRLKKTCIVCNTLQKERWGREEILYKMPFRHGADFEVIILILKDTFKVAVNGSHLLEYKHRMELDRVDTIFISGKVQVQALGIVPPDSVSFCVVFVFQSTEDKEKLNLFVCLQSSTSTSNSGSSKDSQAVLSASGDLTVPFRGQLVQGLKVGNSIVLQGETGPSSKSFSVNLRGRSHSDIALHLNANLNRGVFVRNSFLSECWGPEETELDSFPFVAGQYFEMIILCDSKHFRVAVNGQHQLQYRHRVQDLSAIDMLEVLGDVRLLAVMKM
ncbi:Galectin-8 [Oryzias melastigma]|uniref:Galectin n=1 Tax=Oryzias melastigma TaxID=30732 RepID=A0A834FKJ7_ORYME|nr:Galectin-8 [Oryzias melastigma]